MRSDEAYTIAVIIFVAYMLLLSRDSVALTQAQQTTSTYPGWQFDANGQAYAVSYIELNQQEWDQGLMNISSMDNNTFALFVFPNKATWPFWMKNTYVPLDMIWVNGSKVIYVAQALPCIYYDANQNNCPVYAPQQGVANYVIEAKAGFAQRANITVGSTINVHSPNAPVQ